MAESRLVTDLCAALSKQGIKQYIATVEGQDTTLTYTAIGAIIEKEKDNPGWSELSIAWTEMQALTKKVMAHLTPFSRSEKIDPLVYEAAIQKVANCIQEVKLSEANAVSARLLVCTVEGLNKRNAKLDAGGGMVLRSLKSYTKTKDSEGKDRQGILKPILLASQVLEKRLDDFLKQQQQVSEQKTERASPSLISSENGLGLTTLDQETKQVASSPSFASTSPSPSSSAESFSPSSEGDAKPAGDSEEEAPSRTPSPIETSEARVGTDFGEKREVAGQYSVDELKALHHAFVDGLEKNNQIYKEYSLELKKVVSSSELPELREKVDRLSHKLADDLASANQIISVIETYLATTDEEGFSVTERLSQQHAELEKLESQLESEIKHQKVPLYSDKLATEYKLNSTLRNAWQQASKQQGYTEQSGLYSPQASIQPLVSRLSSIPGLGAGVRFLSNRLQPFSPGSTESSKPAASLPEAAMRTLKEAVAAKKQSILEEIRVQEQTQSKKKILFNNLKDSYATIQQPLKGLLEKTETLSTVAVKCHEALHSLEEEEQIYQKQQQKAQAQQEEQQVRALNTLINNLKSAIQNFIDSKLKATTGVKDAIRQKLFLHSSEHKVAIQAKGKLGGISNVEDLRETLTLVYTTLGPKSDLLKQIQNTLLEEKREDLIPPTSTLKKG